MKIELENVTFVGANPECHRNGNTLTWHIGDLKPGEMNFTVTVEAVKEGSIATPTHFVPINVSIKPIS